MRILECVWDLLQVFVTFGARMPRVTPSYYFFVRILILIVFLSFFYAFMLIFNTELGSIEYLPYKSGSKDEIYYRDALNRVIMI